jgi:hypothetical protein
MFERGVGVEEIEHVVAGADVVEARPDDLPYPTRLLLGKVRGRPLHVLVADATAERQTIVITVYEPDPVLWWPGFRRRRRP